MKGVYKFSLLALIIIACTILLILKAIEPVIAMSLFSSVVGFVVAKKHDEDIKP